MSLREDNGPYCLIWLGLLLMGGYYANFVYMIWTGVISAADILSVSNFFMFLLVILPPVMVFLFGGYLRPTRGKAKQTMFGLSVFVAMFYVIFANLVGSDILGNLITFSAWGIGSAILTAGGFSIVQSYEQSTSSGMLDVSSLHYGPPKDEPEPESEPEVEAPVEVPEVTSDVETSES